VNCLPFCGEQSICVNEAAKLSWLLMLHRQCCPEVRAPEEMVIDWPTEFLLWL